MHFREYWPHSFTSKPLNLQHLTHKPLPRFKASNPVCCDSTVSGKIGACNVLGECSDELIKDMMDESASTASLSVDSNRSSCHAQLLESDVVPCQHVCGERQFVTLLAELYGIQTSAYLARHQ